MIEDFYPTPKSLIYKMLQGVKWNELDSILEPSAGKGDICDLVKTRVDNYSRRENIIDVIEINPDLQHVLRGKGYNLIQDNFLAFETSKCYDLIIANFPFSNGDEHLRQALRLLEKNGGQLVCLVNAETIRKQHTKLRQDIDRKLTDLGATIDFLPGEFLQAERPTDVEVALIRVNVEIQPTFSVVLEELKRATEKEAGERPETQVVEHDFKSAMVARFNLECNVGAKLIDEYFALVPHMMDRHRQKDASNDYSSPLIELKVKDARGRDSRSELINSYLAGTREKYWQILIKDPRYTGQYTSNIVEDLQRKLKELRNCDFNLFNIEQLAKDLQSRVTKGVEDAILKLFDTLSRKFAWDESIHQKNVHYYNGWKTNQSWKINRKVIIPMNGICANYSRGYRFDYHVQQELADMVKVFNYLAPEKVHVGRLVGNTMQAAENCQNFTNVDFRYFEATFYKKRTCHIKFKDPDLLDKFNIFGSQRKGWLPPSYGRKSYDEMDKDERDTVDTFQGKEKYEQVMKNPNYYIVEDAAGLLSSGDEENL